MIKSVLHILEKIAFRRSSILSTIVFNLHYLPFIQAVHMPIMLYKPKFSMPGGGRRSVFNLKGAVKIKCPKVYRGMIKSGYEKYPSYLERGFGWANDGVVIFNGRCTMG